MHLDFNCSFSTKERLEVSSPSHFLVYVVSQHTHLNTWWFGLRTILHILFWWRRGKGRGEGKITVSPSIKCKPRKMSTFCNGVSLMAGRSHEFFRQHCASRSWLCLTLRYRVSRCPALPPDLQAEPAANWLRGRHFPDQICYQLLKVDIISGISSFSKRSVHFLHCKIKDCQLNEMLFYDRFLRLLSKC